MSVLAMIDLNDASLADCGGKAATLGALRRAGLPVPTGFVLPFSVRETTIGGSASHVRAALRAAVIAGLSRLGDVAVAVRSSADGEDGPGASAAGQYESFLGVEGSDAVINAVEACWASASSTRVAEYRKATGESARSVEPRMAVIVQRHIDADVSGVMFTSSEPGCSTRIEASWGLGLSVVGGAVTPDAYDVQPDGAVRMTVGTKATRIDRAGHLSGVQVREVSAPRRTAPTLDDAVAVELARLGERAADLFGGPQDIEWAIADGRTWLLQARPVTASLPPARLLDTSEDVRALTGTPGSRGVATGPARIIRGSSEFSRVRPGDILISPYTDPAWTPLFTIAAGVVTQAGGALSHAAIVAREYGIPAVLGVPDATSLIPDGALVTLDGTSGTLTLH